MVKQANNYLYEVMNRCIEEMDNEHHCVFEHSYKTDDQLKTRLSSRVEGVKGASCFYEDVDIAETVSDIIYDSMEILPWLKNTAEKTDLVVYAEYPDCGKKFLKSREHDWSTGAINCNTVALVLGKKTDIAGCVTKMYIKTCYPI